MEDKRPTIIVDNVRCRLVNFEQEVISYINNLLTVKVPNAWFNPMYKKGLWDGKERFLLRPANTFPTGLLPMVVQDIEKIFGLDVELVDKRINNQYKLEKLYMGYEIAEDKIARDYQLDTVNKLITKKVKNIPFMRGVFNISTNGGKTGCATMILKEIYPQLVNNNHKMLFITHSKEIAAQAIETFEKELGIEIGFIGNGKWVEKPITVAIVTTLFRRIGTLAFEELVRDTMGFIADECHHSSSNSWYEVFNLLKNAYIRVGLTGTVDKANPVNEMKLYACTSEIVKKVTNDYLIEKGVSARPICIMFNVSEPELGRIDYPTAYQKGIVENEVRNDIIKRICKKEMDNGNVTLILLEHIEQGELLLNALESLSDKVYFTNGTLTSIERNFLLKILKERNVDVLISTAILDEGVDVSGINAVIYARGGKSRRKLLQGIGRGLRKKADGSKLRFYDFIDDTHKNLLEHSNIRYKTLKGEKFKVKLLDINNFENMTIEEINE